MSLNVTSDPGNGAAPITAADSIGALASLLVSQAAMTTETCERTVRLPANCTEELGILIFLEVLAIRLQLLDGSLSIAPHLAHRERTVAAVRWLCLEKVAVATGYTFKILDEEFAEILRTYQAALASGEGETARRLMVQFGRNTASRVGGRVEEARAVAEGCERLLERALMAGREEDALGAILRQTLW